MLRKLAVWLLLIPLPFNGLWMVCQDAPAAETESVNLFAQQMTGLDSAQSASSESKDDSECVKECSMKKVADTGALCIVSADGKGSITISLFGVPLIAPQIVVQPLVAAAETVFEPANQYYNPTMAVISPPPKA